MSLSGQFAQDIAVSQSALKHVITVLRRWNITSSTFQSVYAGPFTPCAPLIRRVRHCTPSAPRIRFPTPLPAWFE